MTGATGLIGVRLGQKLVSKGYKLRILTRDPRKSKRICKFPHESVKWNGDLDNPVSAEHLLDVEAVIHLAGHGIADKRWTEDVKQKIYDSRIKSTKSLLTHATKNLKVFIGASAIGYYQASDEKFDETGPVGDRFLSTLCQDWEAEAYKHLNSEQVRVCHLRTGLVLARSGGALKKMLLPFKLGVGGKMGSGQQYMSWIDLEDLIDLYVFALENKKINGPINAVAPDAIRNQEFTKTIGKILKRPTFFTVPQWALKTAVGELADELLLSQNISSQKIRELGFKFTYPEISLSLKKNIL